jgi:predicted Rossmann fold nucleotide-binding protein DprA/Smf involved in DNA uptake
MLRGSSLIALTEVQANTSGETTLHNIAASTGIFFPDPNVLTLVTVGGAVNSYATMHSAGTLTMQAAGTLTMQAAGTLTMHSAGATITNSAGATIDPVQSLRNVVSAIREGRGLPSTPAFEELLARAAVSQRPVEDIASCAQHLAEDVGDLND